jgi:hypothetical protein
LVLLCVPPFISSMRSIFLVESFGIVFFLPWIFSFCATPCFFCVLYRFPCVCCWIGWLLWRSSLYLLFRFWYSLWDYWHLPLFRTSLHSPL